MPRKPVDTTKGLVPMVRNPATGRYVRVDSRIGRGLFASYEPSVRHIEAEQEEISERPIKKQAKRSTAQLKKLAEQEKGPRHPVEIDEIARQLDLLRQKLVPADIPDQMD